MNILEWERKGRPDGVPFSVRREFELADLDRFGADRFQKYVEAVLVAAAMNYAGEKDFKFLPMDSLTKQVTDCTVFESHGGEIVCLIGNERLVAGVFMEVYR